MNHKGYDLFNLNTIIKNFITIAISIQLGQLKFMGMNLVKN